MDAAPSVSPQLPQAEAQTYAMPLHPPSAARPEMATVADTTDTTTLTPQPDVQQIHQDKPAIGFGGLSNEFLLSMQSALEKLGYDLSSTDLMAQLASEWRKQWALCCQKRNMSDI